MEITQNTFLKFIDFSELTNWSVQYLKGAVFSYNKNFELVSIGDFLTRNKTTIQIKDGVEYKRVTIKMNNNGIFLRDKEFGEKIGTKKQFIIKEGQFLLSKIDARGGAFGVVPKEVDNAIITGNFWTFDVDYKKINPHFLSLLTTTKEFLEFAENASNGTTNRHYLQEDLFLNVKIPLPSLSEQNRIVENYKNNFKKAKEAEKRVLEAEKEIEKYLMEELGIEIEEKKERKKGLQFIDFIDLDIWNIWNKQVFIKSKKYNFIKIGNSIGNLKNKISKIQKNEYLEEGNIPIISQENTLISGYTNKNIKTINGEDLPLIAFGDHSKTVKYIDFEFVCGADGVRLMKPIKDFNIKFYYYYILLVVNFINPTESYTRHWKYLSDINIPLPPLEIQEKIVNHIGKLKEEIKELKGLALELREGAKEKFEGEIFS